MGRGRDGKLRLTYHNGQSPSRHGQSRVDVHPTSRLHADDLCAGLADNHSIFKCTFSDDYTVLREHQNEAHEPDSRPYCGGETERIFSAGHAGGFNSWLPSLLGEEKGRARDGVERSAGGMRVPRGDSKCSDISMCANCRLNYLWRWARAARLGLEIRDKIYVSLQQGDWSLPDLDGCLRRPNISSRCVIKRLAGYSRPFLQAVQAFASISNSPTPAPPSPPLQPVDVRRHIASPTPGRPSASAASSATRSRSHSHSHSREGSVDWGVNVSSPPDALEGLKGFALPVSAVNLMSISGSDSFPPTPHSAGECVWEGGEVGACGRGGRWVSPGRGR